jgi:hypothetical protein
VRDPEDRAHFVITRWLREIFGILRAGVRNPLAFPKSNRGIGRVWALGDLRVEPMDPTIAGLRQKAGLPNPRPADSGMTPSEGELVSGVRAQDHPIPRPGSSRIFLRGRVSHQRLFPSSVSRDRDHGIPVPGGPESLPGSLPGSGALLMIQGSEIGGVWRELRRAKPRPLTGCSHSRDRNRHAIVASTSSAEPSQPSGMSPSLSGPDPDSRIATNGFEGLPVWSTPPALMECLHRRVLRIREQLGWNLLPVPRAMRRELIQQASLIADALPCSQWELLSSHRPVQQKGGA